LLLFRYDMFTSNSLKLKISDQNSGIYWQKMYQNIWQLDFLIRTISWAKFCIFLSPVKT
jgi:hypothetical protein